MTKAIGLLVLLLAVNAAAGWQDLPAKDFTMAPPPVPGSAESDADYAALLKLQASRKPEECAAAAAELTPDFQSLFGNSGILNKNEVATILPFLDSASKVLSKISSAFKKQFMRPRPYDVDARIKPCIDKPGGNTSYPSGHAALGTFDACVLGQLFPARANALVSHGRLIGDLRALAGVHHPSDVVAGQVLGEQVCARLLKEPDFVTELDQVKQSLP